jgi:tRNA pseudouridine55 synthase
MRVGVRHLFEKVPMGIWHAGSCCCGYCGWIGFGARLFNYIIDKEKEYICELMLGVTTDTQDAEGRILEKHSVDVPRDQLQEILAQFTGDILQTPPAYSAVMKDGQKLYAIARSGGDTTVAQRPAHIDTLEILQQLTPAR